MSIHAIVVDDEPLARDELRFMLGQCEDIEVVGEARNAPEAQTLCDEQQPDVAFLDLRMPGPDGVALAETLMATHPELRVVIVARVGRGVGVKRSGEGPQAKQAGVYHAALVRLAVVVAVIVGKLALVGNSRVVAVGIAAL